MRPKSETERHRQRTEFQTELTSMGKRLRVAKQQAEALERAKAAAESRMAEEAFRLEAEQAESERDNLKSLLEQSRASCEEMQGLLTQEKLDREAAENPRRRMQARRPGPQEGRDKEAKNPLRGPGQRPRRTEPEVKVRKRRLKEDRRET